MSESIVETQKRLRLAEDIVSKYESIANTILLAGSVAYSPNNTVSKNSDLDLLVITDELRKNISAVSKNTQEINSLENRFFEGYCIQEQIEDVPVSIHFLSTDAMDVISKVFVGDIRVYRTKKKEGEYSLKNFEGKKYTYNIKNIPLEDLPGVRTIVPISFINQDSYFIGIHRDKLLSNPVFLFEKDTYGRMCVENTWKTVSQNLIDESMRRMGKIDLDSMSILHALAKSNRMNEDVIQSIEDKTKFYISQLK